MSKIFKHTKLAKRIIYKMRHHRGHGIHSPFIFSMVNNVIEEKRSYYCYDDLQQYIGEFSGNTYKANKVSKLSFRLANFFDVETIVELGAGRGIDSLYLTAHRQFAKCYCFENNELDKSSAHKLLACNDNIVFFNHFEDFSKFSSIDCLSIDLNRLTLDQKYYLHFHKNEFKIRSFILVKNIRQTKENLKLWKSLTEINNRTAILDLFNHGIILFNSNLYKWNYQISF